VEEIPRATCPEQFAKFLYNSDKEVMLLSYMWKVSSPNLGTETENTQKRDLLLFYSVLPGKCQFSTLNYGWIASFHALSASIFTTIMSVYAVWCVCTGGYCICVNEGRVADPPEELSLPQGSNRLLSACLPTCFSVFNGLLKQTSLKRTVPVYRIILGHSRCAPHHSA